MKVSKELDESIDGYYGALQKLCDVLSVENNFKNRLQEMKRDTEKGFVICHDCRFAVGYHPMYVGDDWRKWGTSVCMRTNRHRRVDMLSYYDGCRFGEHGSRVSKSKETRK